MTTAAIRAAALAAAILCGCGGTFGNVSPDMREHTNQLRTQLNDAHGIFDRALGSVEPLCAIAEAQSVEPVRDLCATFESAYLGARAVYSALTIAIDAYELGNRPFDEVTAAFDTLHRLAAEVDSIAAKIEGVSDGLVDGGN